MNFFLPLHTYFGSWQTTRFGEYFLKTLGDALKLKFPAVSPSYSPTVRMPANSLTDAVCAPFSSVDRPLKLAFSST